MPDLTLEQKRAKHAIETVQAYSQQKIGHYVSYVSAMPAQIISNGLGQTLASLLAAAGRTKVPKADPHFSLSSHVTAWLVCQIPELANPNSTATPTPIDVVKRLMELDQKNFIRAQTEALLYLDWLKKFARALLKDEAATSTEQSAMQENQS